ncbi:MAG: transcriptional regulator [Deltaproteobacteria bacterium]|nr:transcriptional regulator [Deltaproteobacteria bacterium]
MNNKELDFLKRLAKGLVKMYGKRCEVVIHDFTDITRSVIHIEGEITHRAVGAPITDLVFRLVNEFGDDAPDKIGYKNTTDDGRILKSSTFFTRDGNGKLEGCFCINFDVTDFMFLSTAFTEFNPFEMNDNSGTQESYTKSFPETMESVIDSAIAKCGKIPATMDRNEKMELVRQLEKSGVFKIKGAVNYMAKTFGSSKYTIYNYIKEVR